MALAVSLLFVFLIALLQQSGAADAFNLAGMRVAGAAREMQGGGVTTAVMQAVSMAGGSVGRLLLFNIALVGLLWQRQRFAALWLTFTMAGGTLLNLGLKQLFAAPRPDLLPHLDIVNSYSFPSGHAAGNMILFGAIAMLITRRAAYMVCGVIILLIGVSRTWLGVHWPTDVLAGWIVGLGWLAFCRCWLPAGGREEQRVAQAVMGGHTVGGDKAVNPEAVEGAGHRHGEQQ
ncbi:undecaprenyl-diphosphatase [Sphingobium vermicomposti]|uniref:Undecaprenyl-diphosphatase n=1 Tax=Sphingobium vermicomposti TaxID=529005 RepID=A0A846M4E5_9SPHN|nr:undecaprenyl-diphosphatase [Sphingobium vermicomposti]